MFLPYILLSLHTTYVHTIPTLYAHVNILIFVYTRIYAYQMTMRTARTRTDPPSRSSRQAPWPRHCFSRWRARL